MEKFFNTAGPQKLDLNYSIDPLSIVLCGVRGVRDYRIVLSNQDIITGGSAFNIKAESLWLGNFTREEIRELYMQHTRARRKSRGTSASGTAAASTTDGPSRCGGCRKPHSHELK